jgi:hypothetical protein
MNALPSQRWPDPEQIAKRAAEVLSYWTDGRESLAMFTEVAGELFDTDETGEALYVLHEAGDTAELGAQMAGLIKERLANKAQEYAEDEANGDLGPSYPRVPHGYISHKKAMAKAREHAAKYRAMVAGVRERSL